MQRSPRGRFSGENRRVLHGELSMNPKKWFMQVGSHQLFQWMKPYLSHLGYHPQPGFVGLVVPLMVSQRCPGKREREVRAPQTSRWIDRQIDRYIDRQINQIDKLDRQIDRQTDRQMFIPLYSPQIPNDIFFVSRSETCGRQVQQCGRLGFRRDLEGRAKKMTAELGEMSPFKNIWVGHEMKIP